jgi:hypothetical protein
MSFRRWMLALAVLACVVPGVALAQRLTPLVSGWERFFSITAVETVQKGGKARVTGYLNNESGFHASRMRLLIDGLDDSGQIVGQSVAYVPSPNPGPSGRVYFDEPAPAGTRHRVSVFAYDFVQSAMNDAP